MEISFPPTHPARLQGARRGLARIRRAAAVGLAAALWYCASTFAFAGEKSEPPSLSQLQHDWSARLGANPAFETTLKQYLKSQMSLRLPDPNSYPVHDNWQPIADAGSALVNLYRLSGDTRYRDQAKRIADWLLAANDYLTAHRDRTIPYLGWGPENRQGYFKCSTVGRYQADDLWDTAAVLRLLLKYSEIEPNPTRSPYLKRAQSIIDRWKYVDRSLDDGAYARAGMRWYMKSNDPCEIRYVKNTNLVMAEQLLRIYRITKQANYLRSAVLAINAELWDVLTRRNLAYSSFMIYEDRSEPVYTEMTAQNESKIVHTAQSRPDDTLMCNGHDSSCWNHLGFEGYDLYLIEQLIAEIDENKFPVPGTKRDISKAREQIMGVYRSSSFGNTERFPWDSKESNTHITAYNCALRFSSPVYEHECLDSLQHHNASGTVFYALVPDAIFTRSTR